MQEGSTALHNAAYKGNSEVVSLLLKAGSNVNLQQAKDKLTALHLACMSGNTATVSVLLKASADTTCKSFDGKDASDIAKENKHVNVQILLRGVSLEDLEKAELAAKFAAARLMNKVLCLSPFCVCVCICVYVCACVCARMHATPPSHMPPPPFLSL